MKNMLKHFGIIVFVAIIGLSMMGCGRSDGGVIRVENTTSDYAIVYFFTGITSIDAYYNDEFKIGISVIQCAPGQSIVYYSEYTGNIVVYCRNDTYDERTRIGWKHESLESRDNITLRFPADFSSTDKYIR